MVDLSYRNDGMFTRFYPNTADGEHAWREMAKLDGVAAVLSFEAPKVIRQLRAAGYSVAKEQTPVISIDEILAELDE